MSESMNARIANRGFRRQLLTTVCAFALLAVSVCDAGRRRRTTAASRSYGSLALAERSTRSMVAKTRIWRRLNALCHGPPSKLFHRKSFSACSRYGLGRRCRNYVPA